MQSRKWAIPRVFTGTHNGRMGLLQKSDFSSKSPEPIDSAASAYAIFLGSCRVKADRRLAVPAGPEGFAHSSNFAAGLC